MDADFKELEELVIADMRKTYSEAVIDHFLNPRNLGEIPHAEGFARVTGPCGDTMKIWLRVKNGIVSDVTFWTDGCGPSIACGSMATELVKGRSTAEALRITQKDVLNSLGGLLEESLHCALLAADTLKGALRDHLAMKNEPWKRDYRNT